MLYPKIHGPPPNNNMVRTKTKCVTDTIFKYETVQITFVSWIHEQSTYLYAAGSIYLGKYFIMKTQFPRNDFLVLASL